MKDDGFDTSNWLEIWWCYQERRWFLFNVSFLDRQSKMLRNSLAWAIGEKCLAYLVKIESRPNGTDAVHIWQILSCTIEWVLPVIRVFFLSVDVY